MLRVCFEDLFHRCPFVVVVLVVEFGGKGCVERGVELNRRGGGILVGALKENKRRLTQNVVLLARGVFALDEVKKFFAEIHFSSFFVACRVRFWLMSGLI